MEGTLSRTCEICGIDITDRRASAVTCSAKCRKVLHNKRSLEQNGTETGTLSVAEPEHLDVWFEFYTVSKANGLGRTEDQKSELRKAKYWYDVPLSAIPVVKKGWPEVPVFETKEGPVSMNGRQYFLWWKNDFKMDEKFPDSPQIHNPYPALDNVKYEMGGEGARRWGA